MEKNLELMLEGNRFATLSINQYSKGFNVKCKLLNYTYTEGDTASVEFNINDKLYYIQSTNITIENDTVIFRVNREVTLNSGKGYFNVVITNGDVRTSNFKANLEIVGNSIDENTVSSAFIVTAKEELDTTITEADTKITELNTLIESTTVTELNGKVDKEDGKGLSTNDFTDEYKTKIDTNSSNIATLQTEVNSINGSNADTPIEFNLTCLSSEAIKHANSTHNWYIVRNGFCFLHLDLDIVNASITTVAAIKGLPLQFNTNKEIWNNITGQGTNVSSNLSIKLSADTDTYSTTTLTIDKASAKGRYMGAIVYPIAINNGTANTEE